MKNIKLLKELLKKKILVIVEPSVPIKESYIKKSESSLISAKILLDNNRLEESVALTYYSMYHSTTALFYRVGIKCENHTATIQLLKDIFEINNTSLEFAKSERLDKQYYTDFHVTKEQVKESIFIAEEFNAFILDFISKLNNFSIQNYKNKFNNLMDQLK